MTEEKKDLYLELLQDKIEPNLPRILQKFRAVIQEYGVSEFNVISFSLELNKSEDSDNRKSSNKSESLVNKELLAQGRMCKYPCESDSNSTCYRICKL